MDFSPFIKAELLQREVGVLIGVCRVTVNRWYMGATNPHHLISTRVHQVLDVIEAAVDDGTLPLSPDLPKSEREAQLRKVVSDYDE